jgi:hypothetical protein
LTIKLFPSLRYIFHGTWKFLLCLELGSFSMRMRTKYKIEIKTKQEH